MCTLTDHADFLRLLIVLFCVCYGTSSHQRVETEQEHHVQKEKTNNTDDEDNNHLPITTHITDVNHHFLLTALHFCLTNLFQSYSSLSMVFQKYNRKLMLHLQFCRATLQLSMSHTATMSHKQELIKQIGQFLFVTKLLCATCSFYLQLCRAIRLRDKVVQQNCSCDISFIYIEIRDFSTQMPFL